MTTAGGLRLFLDRSTNAKRFAEAARELCPDVQTIGDLYGITPAETVMDERWIADASAAGRICVGADKAILSNLLELQAILDHSARYLVFTDNNTPTRQRIAHFRELYDQLVPLAAIPGPWVYKLTRGGLQEVNADLLRARLDQARERLGKCP
ncbi:hypothetical protein PV755_00855 [Streptomyces caniscabiei]|uniref:PIN-like domain-containing protein n=1 Tax=Streptomyces caniscabiei TaxID=2746961 RepID=UPI0029B0853E|nr:hypothetical protein [Streptomyces caniscabiei]MDX3507484.1 hypothetical protein [Streptomyces caniscabiei]